MAKTQQTTGTTLTSQPERIPIIGTTFTRSGSVGPSSSYKDSRLINCFQESIKSEITNSYKTYCVKRPGVTRTSSFSATGTPRGYIYWNNKHYIVVGDKLYSNGSSIQTLSTSTGFCGFEEVLNANIKYLVLVDGTDGYRISTADAVVKINQTLSAWQASTNYALGDRVIPTVTNGYYYEVTADAGSSGGSQPTWPTSIDTTVVDSGITWTCKGEYGGFPTPHIPRPKFVDGYLLLAKASSQDIYNSDVDNVLGWGSSNFISAEMWPDNIVSLSRQNNLIVAFGQSSTEFFYDAASGTAPFARSEGTVMQMGCAAPYSIFEQERFCVFIGQSKSGGRAVWLIEGTQPKKISNESIERILDNEGSNLSSVTGFGIRALGHLFYVARLATVTIVYDIEEKVWHEWSSNNSGAHRTFDFIYQADPDDGTSYLTHMSDGYIYKMADLAYNDDNGTNILVDIYTPKYDGGTMNRKSQHNLTLVGDSSVGGFQIRWSDDDYTTWSSLKTLSGIRPFFTRLGSFRRRSFNIKHAYNEAMRLESIESEIDVGTH